ncbi:MAG: hypothetical protein ISN28_01420 [Ectothiorhodospiraceae bacterium AqS1]|nr:hypothetical protein [Ectothiorhodospiraceae bacterium AqS1]
MRAKRDRLSASDIKTVSGALGDEALDCALRSRQRIPAPIRFHAGEADTLFIDIGCLAPQGERCTETEAENTDDAGRCRRKIKVGTIGSLEGLPGLHRQVVPTTSSSMATKTGIPARSESDGRFMVRASRVSAKRDLRPKTGHHLDQHGVDFGGCR